MNLSKATNQQLQNIIEWDNHIPALLLYPVYEECVKRDIFKPLILGLLQKNGGTEQRTKMTFNELKWIMYQAGFDVMQKFKPGNRPFIALWSHRMKWKLRDIIRDLNAQKRSTDLVDIDEMVLSIPASNHNTERTALNRIYVDYLFSQLTEIEKEIVIKRSEGYTLKEIGKMQGVSVGGIQKRIEVYVKRLKESEDETIPNIPKTYASLSV